MSDAFGITEEVRGRTVLLRVRGKLDARSAPHLQEVGSRIRARKLNLVLDLSGVTFMASSGLGSLLSLAEEFRQSECRVRLASPSPAVESVIHLLNLHQFLTIDASEQESIHALET